MTTIGGEPRLPEAVAPSQRLRSPGVRRAFWLAVAVALPLGVLLMLFSLVVWGDAELIDFRSFYTAGGAVLDGQSPYPEYVYPPLTAIVTAPLSAVPLGLAEAVVIVVLAVAVVGTLLALGVEDWRCYGICFLWPPVIAAIQTGNITILLGLGAALAWRYRDRALPCAVAIGVTLAAKFFLWPLVVFAAGARRYATAALACASGFLLLVLSWAALGFAGLSDYGDTLNRVQGTVEHDSYTAYVVALDLGAPAELARVIWLGLGFGLLAAVVVLARRGDERSAFMLAVAASLALTPIVWLHYFALLAVVVALAAPRLGLVWFVPLLLVVTPGTGRPTTFETIWTLAVAALVVGMSVHAVRQPEQARPLEALRA